ncbi:MAG: hypothetical protein KC731_12435 [Myxococcales bacterium]|nr:hypothetical protein [Myxococcales bacterium]
MNNHTWPGLVLVASAMFALPLLSGPGCDQPVEGFAGPPMGGNGGEGGAASTGGMGPTTGGGGQGGGVGDPTLPLAVDDFFPGRAAFGSDNGAPLHTEDEDCPERAPDDPVGVCHHITHPGGAGTFTGAFWINGGSFEDINPVAVEPGATEVTFYAWGASGGEVVEVGAGLGDADGAEDRRQITLTPTPTQYSVPLTNLAGYTEINAAFIFAVGEAAVELYIDDIELVKGEPIGGPLTLPMVVDEGFPDRSAFGSNGGGPWHTEETDSCPMRAGSQAGLCHTLVYGGESGFTGAIWTVGSSFMNLESRTIEAGADAVQFYAWSASGAPQVEFGALDTGLGDAEQVRSVETLSTTPTQYTIPLPGNGAEITTKAAFVFAGASDLNPSGFTIYVDDIQWVDLP